MTASVAGKSTILEAASVLLSRGPGSHEVFLVERSPNLRFMGGMTAFPGGKVHPTDTDLVHPTQGVTERHVAAVRELFEETGVLLVRQEDGRFPAASADLNRLRGLLLEDAIPFADVLRQYAWKISPSDLLPAGRLITPAFVPVRFDTAFFVADLPPGQHAEVWPGELTTGHWSSADSALEQWRQGRLILSPPTYAILQTIHGLPVRALPARLQPELDRLDRGRLPAIWLNPGVLMVPLDCQGPAPTTHTNAYLVGTGPVYLLDPGPRDPAEQDKLFEILEGKRLDAVVLTHHHPDHVGAATECARRYRVPILAHARTAELLRGQVEVDRHIAAGEWLDLGKAPHGQGRWGLQALLTPGHAPGHLAFYEPDYQLLFAGDMVSTISSMIITPEDGDIAVYLHSLRVLRDYPMRLLLPAHGGPSTRGGAVIEEAIAHREQREQQLLEVLGQPRTIEEMALEIYRGFPEPVLKLARWQIHAGLIKLQREGRAIVEANRWRRTGP